MGKLEHIKEDLEQIVYDYLEADEGNNFKNICTHELGEVIDMIKDVTTSMYYCSVVKAMEENSNTVAQVTMSTEKV